MFTRSIVKSICLTDLGSSSLGLCENVRNTLTYRPRSLLISIIQCQMPRHFANVNLKSKFYNVKTLLTMTWGRNHERTLGTLNLIFMINTGFLGGCFFSKNPPDYESLGWYINTFIILGTGSNHKWI